MKRFRDRPIARYLAFALMQAALFTAMTGAARLDLSLVAFVLALVTALAAVRASRALEARLLRKQYNLPDYRRGDDT